MPRIALLTPFSPELGGGSAQLRSHLRYLPDLDVQWQNLAKQAATNPQYNWLGPRFTTSELLSDLSARTGFLPGSKSLSPSLFRLGKSSSVYQVRRGSPSLSLFSGPPFCFFPRCATPA